MFSFLRVVKFALQDIGRNFGLSFMTVFILVLMLLSVNMLWSVDVLTKEAVGLVKDQVNVSIYFNPDVADKDIQGVETYLQTFPEVVNLQLVSKDQVLASFKDRHSGSQEVLDALSELGTNPFGETLMIKAKEPADYNKIIAALDVPEYDKLISGKSYDGHEDAVTRLQDITNRVEQVGFWLTVLFAVISFLIIFNTIRVAIFTHKAEIGIKRLVGASSWFIRGPYFMESIIFSVLSVAITVGIIFLSLRFFDPYLTIVFPNNFSLTNYYSSHILLLFGTQTLAVLALTIVSSSLAMRRQLKV